MRGECKFKIGEKLAWVVKISMSSKIIQGNKIKEIKKISKISKISKTC